MTPAEQITVYEEQRDLAKADIERIQKEGWKQFRRRDGDDEYQDVTIAYLHRQQRIVTQMEELIEVWKRKAS